MAYVYRHIRLDKNVPFYIGLGTDSNYSRAHQTKSRNQHWHNVVKNSEYRVEIMLDDLSFEEACVKEIELISVYGRVDTCGGSLVNWTDGGQGTLGWRHEVGYWTGKSLPESMCKNLSEVAKLRVGEKNHFYGKNHSEETKEKLRQSRLGSTLTEETKLKIKESLKNSEAFKNRKHSVRLGADNPKSKQVINTETGETYENLRIASEITEISYNKLRSYCQGKVKSKTNWNYLL
jgi:hypothetical protein